MMYLTLLPAYGRDYKTKKSIINDLNALKDFIVSHSGQYINKQQFNELGITSFKSVLKNGLVDIETEDMICKELYEVRNIKQF